MSKFSDKIKMRIPISERIKLLRLAIDSLENQETNIHVASDAIARAVWGGHRIYAAGNGGSAAEAMHFATELSGRYRSNRNSMPAMALNSDGTALTCIANDFGWEEVFARQLGAFGAPGDVFLAISTSGNSPNVLRGLEVAKRCGLTTIGLLGKGGGEALALCDIAIVIESRDTGAIQEAHLVAVHMLCELLEPEEQEQ
jgi:D-sedoheptulose 7-phosphate isomerase